MASQHDNDKSHGLTDHVIIRNLFEKWENRMQAAACDTFKQEIEKYATKDLLKFELSSFEKLSIKLAHI